MNVMMKILSKSMISCEKAAFLASKSMDDGLNLQEKIKLKMHTAACKYCLWYEKEINNLNAIFHTIHENTLSGKIVYHLSEEKKDEIQAEVNKKIKK
mgnify:CR=1 FL=1